VSIFFLSIVHLSETPHDQIKTMEIDSELLDKFIKGDCTDEEIEKLTAYFNQADKKQWAFMLQQAWDHMDYTGLHQDKEAKAEIWQKLQDNLVHSGRDRHTQTKRYTYMVTGIAASILLLMISGFFLFKASDNTEKSDSLIIQTNTGFIPLRIALEDESIVWLKPGSQLKYPQTMSSQYRQVILEGEAFFQVKREEKRPFVVETGVVQTKVLGTTFHVNARKAHQHIEVALLSGRVEVQLMENERVRSLDTLMPGEAFTFQKSSKEFAIKSLQDPVRYQWNDGIIRFNRASINEVVETLENWYGISITIQDRDQIHETLVHRIDTKKMTLDQVLEGINLVARYRFEKISKEEYVVKPF